MQALLFTAVCSLDLVSLLFAKSVSHEVPPWWAVKGKILTFRSPDPWKMHFQHTFWLQTTSCPYWYTHQYYGLVIKCTKSHQPSWCIKVGNNPPPLPKLPCLGFIFFLVTRHDWVIWSCLVQIFPFYVWANFVQFQ